MPSNPRAWAKAPASPAISSCRPATETLAKGAGGNEEGGYQFILELKIDDIVDWLWEELKLPNLKVKSGAVQYDDYTREGWSRRGVRSRLDRRRSLKEALKRRAVQHRSAAVHERRFALSPARACAAGPRRKPSSISRWTCRRA